MGVGELHCRSPRVVYSVDVICSHNLANFIGSHLHGLIKVREERDRVLRENGTGKKETHCLQVKNKPETIMGN